MPDARQHLVALIASECAAVAQQVSQKRIQFAALAILPSQVRWRKSQAMTVAVVGAFCASAVAVCASIPVAISVPIPALRSGRQQRGQGNSESDGDALECDQARRDAPILDARYVRPWQLRGDGELFLRKAAMAPPAFDTRSDVGPRGADGDGGWRRRRNRHDQGHVALAAAVLRGSILNQPTAGTTNNGPLCGDIGSGGRNTESSCDQSSRAEKNRRTYSRAVPKHCQ